jgi:membrane protein implicated in regulation of membrane protease activity
MGHVYLFALVVSLGVLLVQIVMGGRAGHHGDLGHAHGHAGHAAHAMEGEEAFWTLFLSLRFWIFASLGFGLSGSLLHVFALAHPILTFLIAGTAGFVSGVFATLAFRLLRRGSAATEVRSSVAAGKVGRVVVPCGRGLTGKVRVEVAGSSVDLMATTDDESIARGDAVLVEEVRDGVAHVSRWADPTHIGAARGPKP